MNAARWFIVLALGAVLASCGESPDIRIFTGPDVDAVRARHTAFAAALNKKDAAAVAAFYDIGGAIVEPGYRENQLGINYGRGNKTLLNDPLGAAMLGYVEIEVSGNLAVSQGECRFTRTDPNTGQAQHWFGYCMHSWRRRKDGAWRIGLESRTVWPLGHQ